MCKRIHSRGAVRVVLNTVLPSLESLRRRLALVRAARRLLLILFCLGAPLSPALALAALGGPWWAAWALWLGGAALIGLILLRGLGRAPDLHAAARRAARCHPELGDELESALELAGSGDPYGRLQVERARRLAAGCGLPGSVRLGGELRRPLGAATGLVVLYLLTALVAPQLYHDGWRGLRGLSVEPRAPALLAVTPGDARLRPGETVMIEASFDRSPLEPRLELRRAAGEPWRALSLTPQTPTRHARELEPLDVLETPRLEYRVVHADGVGEVFRLELIPAPRLSALAVRVVPPAYTSLAPRELPEGSGTVTAPRGARVEFEARVEPALESAALRLSTGGERSLSPRFDADGADVSGAFTLSGDGRWSLGFLSRDGLEGASPDYRLVALPDEPPTIELLEPRGAYELDATMSVPLACRVADDYGVAGLELLYTRDGETEVRELARGLGVAARVDYRWDLAGIELLPGDELACRLRVLDNNAVDGPGVALSPVFTVRFPGVEEFLDEGILAGDDEALAELDERGELQSRELEELARRHRGDEEVSWEERRALEELTAEQERIVARAEETLRDLEGRIEALDRENLLTPESLAKLNEVQRLLHESLDDELRRGLEELQRAVDEQLERGRLDELAREFTQSREEFEEGLERMEELLWRARAEQRLAELAAEALETARRAAENAAEPTRAAGEELAESSRELVVEAAETSKLLSDVADDEVFYQAGERVARAGEELGASEAARSLEQSAADARSAEAGAAELADFSEELASALAELRSGQHEQLQRVLAAQVNALLLLAEDFGATRRAAEVGAVDNTELGRRLSATADGLRRVRLGVEEAYRRTAAFDTGIADGLKRLADELDVGAAGSAAGDKAPVLRLGEQLASLNNLTLRLLELQRQAAQSQSGTGLSEMMARLGELAAQQQGLNQDTAAASGGGTPMPDGDAWGGPPSLRSLAARQAAIRQALEELGAGAGEVEGLLGDLGELAGQAGEIEGLLSTGVLGPETRREQETLLRRLLDAQRSLNNEELSRRREARAAGDHHSEPPPPLSIEPGAAEGTLRPAEERLEIELFWPEYRRAILEYLKRLAE